MALAGLIAGLKVTAEQIGELWGRAPELVGWLADMQRQFSGGKVFLEFARIFRSGDPSLTLKDISPLYQSAKFFADRMTYLGDLAPNIPLDRRLAQPTASPTGLSKGGTTMRYRVDLIVTGLPDGKPLVHSHWIDSNYERSRGELLEMAKRKETARWKPAYLPESMGGEGPELDFEIEVTGFQSFYMEGTR